MQTYIKLTENHIFPKEEGKYIPLYLVEGTYVHMKDNIIMACWNENNVPTHVKSLATEMTMHDYMQKTLV